MPLLPTAINGKVPAALLRDLPGLDGDGTPHQVDLLAATSYPRLRAAMQRAGLGDLLPSAGYSCYRTLADQRRMLALGLTSVPAGKSIHGEAKAVDFQGMTGSRLSWMRANASAYGWYQPAWAIHGTKTQGPEPWHWEYDNQLDRAVPDPVPPTPPTPAPTPEGPDLMKPVLAQIDPSVSGRYYLIDFVAGTCFYVRNGLQLGIIQADPDVVKLSGPQPPDLVAGLNVVGQDA